MRFHSLILALDSSNGRPGGKKFCHSSNRRCMSESKSLVVRVCVEEEGGRARRLAWFGEVQEAK